MRDPVAKSAYDRARYAARHVDRRRTVCKRDGCEEAVTQPRHGYALYCSVYCKGRVWAEAHLILHPIAREPLPRPYTGHRWLDMAREVVGDKQFEFGWELYDRYNDEMGEAVLAILEGGNPKDAIHEYRKREYVPRHLTQHIGDWAGEDDAERWHRWEAVMPQTPSAEDEFMASLAT